MSHGCPEHDRDAALLAKATETMRKRVAGIAAGGGKPGAAGGVLTVLVGQSKGFRGRPFATLSANVRRICCNVLGLAELPPVVVSPAVDDIARRLPRFPPGRTS